MCCPSFIFFKKSLYRLLSSSAIIVFFSTNIFAQNWAPVFLNEFFDYKTDTSPRIAQVIKVDSISGNVYFLNKIAKRCCYDTLDYTFNYVINLPGFLQHEIVLSDSDFKLLDPDTLVIKTNYPLNKNWNYDANNSITAKIISWNSSLTYNQNDSVEAILLSTGDSIILSKNYGMLKFPAGNGHYYVQSGLENEHLGTVRLGFDDYFNFNIGDVFQYLSEYADFGNQSGEDDVYKLTIIGKQNLNPGYQYTARNIDQHSIGTGNSNSTSSGIDTIDMIYLPNSFDSTYLINPSEWHKAKPYIKYGFRTRDSVYYSTAGLIYDSLEQQVGCYIDSFSEFQNQYGFCYAYGYTPSNICCSLNDTINPSSSNAIKFDYSFRKGLGQIENHLDDFEQSYFIFMTGYVKGTDTVNIYPDSDFLTAVKPLSQSKSKWQLEPNPARSSVMLTSNIPLFNRGELQIFNTSGKLEAAQILRPFSRSWQIPTLNLSNGIYFLIIKSGNSIERLKLVVSH